MQPGVKLYRTNPEPSQKSRVRNRKIKGWQQCHFPKSSHPLPLPLSPKVRYTPLCLFCCLATCILSCKNQITSLCPTQDTACLGLVHGDDQERSYGEGGGRGVHVWECMYIHGGFMSMYGKTNTVL